MSNFTQIVDRLESWLHMSERGILDHGFERADRSNLTGARDWGPGWTIDYQFDQHSGSFVRRTILSLDFLEPRSPEEEMVSIQCLSEYFQMGKEPQWRVVVKRSYSPSSLLAIDGAELFADLLSELNNKVESFASRDS